MNHYLETFNRVKAHLLKQNAVAGMEMENGDFTCMYRAPDGKMCAVGCLIRPEQYEQDIEGKPIGGPRVDEALAYSGITIDDDMKMMLRSLQGVHDDISPKLWAEHIRFLEKRYKGLFTEGVY